MPAVITLGEILADFVPAGKGYALKPGGAPSNVAVNLSRLGIKTAIIARLGNDFIGDFLYSFLKKNNVNVSMIKRDKNYKTGLVFVFLNKYKDRDFSFYGEPSADKRLSAADISENDIKKCSLLHFGSISMMAKSSAAATLKAIRLAKKYGKAVSFDPNVRLNLWEGKAALARKKIRSYFKFADIVKISDTELKFLFNAAPSAKSLNRIFGHKLVFVSAGEKGCYVFRDGFFRHVSVAGAKVVDSTGAGDAFMAGVIFCVIKAGNLKNLNQNELVSAAGYANMLGRAAVRRKGAV